MSFMGVIDVNVLNSIRKDLNEDPDRLQRQVQLFKEWLNCEPHLPTDIDENLIVNFVRFCKCNLDNAKKRFENYLASRIKWQQTYPSYVFDENYFSHPHGDCYRLISVHPKLTPDGYRIFWYRIPTADKYNPDHGIQYVMLLLDLFFFQDTSSGLIAITDMHEFTAEHLAKVDVKLLIACINFSLNKSPMRLKNFHLFNMPKLAAALISIILKALNEKMAKRVIIHKNMEEMSKYFPDDILFDEYGGKGGSFDEYCEQMKEFLINNEDITRKMASLKLAGPIPSNKTDMYSFEEYGMEGSFRKLNID